MSFVAAKCPQCGGDMQLNNEMETGFCMHCGSKIVIQEAIRAVRIDNTHMIESWMKMGDLAAEGGNQSESYVYYSKVIEVQPNNYWAIYKKGKAAGWQSTLVNIRFFEAATCFGEAIELAPEGEKGKIIHESTEEIKNLALALISLRADRFIKWPDEEEANGFQNDIDTIYNAVIQLANKSGVIVSGYLEPIAAKICDSVDSAWYRTILPDFNGDENHPGRYEWKVFIERIGHCTNLIEKSIDLSDEDDKEDIPRYEKLIFLENEAINCCAWDYEIYSWGKSWRKDYELADISKQYRRATITQHNEKILKIKNKVQQREKAEQQEKERREREEAHKRINDYWSVHKIEKVNLEDERSELVAQLKGLEIEIATLSAPMLRENEKIKNQIDKLREEQKSLGIFKLKEKKALQAQIDAAQNCINLNTTKIGEVVNPLRRKIENIKIRGREINNELTKPR